MQTKTTEAKAPCPLAVMETAADRLAVVIESDNEDALHGASPDDVSAHEALIKARAKVAERFRVADEFHAATVEYIEARDEYDRAAERYGDESNAAPMCDARGRVLRAVKAYRAALAAFSEVQ